MRDILFSYHTMRDLADEICTLGVGAHPEQGYINWSKFGDGYPNISIRGEVGGKYADYVRGRRVSFLASFDRVEDIFEQLAVIYALPRYGVRSLRVILPYFPGTKDRVDEDGDVVTAMTLARMLSAIPLSKEGPAEIVMFDMHAPQERFYFSDQVIPNPMSAAYLFERLLWDQNLERSLNIVFPDEGAWKRFGHTFGRFSQVICQKTRRGDKRVITIKQGDPRGKPAVIVDDLVKSGNTLIECRNALIKAEATEVGAAVVHGSFEPGAADLIRAEDWSYFWTTDSCPAVRYLARAPYRYVSLVNFIQRTTPSS